MKDSSKQRVGTNLQLPPSTTRRASTTPMSGSWKRAWLTCTQRSLSPGHVPKFSVWLILFNSHTPSTARVPTHPAVWP